MLAQSTPVFPGPMLQPSGKTECGQWQQGLQECLYGQNPSITASTQGNRFGSHCSKSATASKQTANAASSGLSRIGHLTVRQAFSREHPSA
jgi:hypothetical protein